MAKEQWDVRSNLKNKPNAQGTLFSGGASQMPDAKRYKKGYNPQRQREVLRQLPAHRVADWVHLQPVGKDGEMVSSPRERLILEHIKQSTVPPEHLKNLSINVIEPGKGAHVEYDIDHGDHGLSSDDVDGVYHAKKGVWNEVIGGRINLRDRATPHTLFHEIGHHASALSGTQHSAYNTVYARGQEEGFADRYADVHTPKGLPGAQGMGNYEPSVAQTGGRVHDFEYGYDQMRPYRDRTPNEEEAKARQSYARARAAEQRRKTTPQLPGLENPEAIRGNVPPAPTTRGSVPPPPPPR